MEENAIYKQTKLPGFILCIKVNIDNTVKVFFSDNLFKTGGKFYDFVAETNLFIYFNDLFFFILLTGPYCQSNFVKIFAFNNFLVHIV